MVFYDTDLTIDEIIDILTIDGNQIKWVNNPPLDLVKLAVRENPRAIRYIKNPPLEVMEMAVLAQPSVLRLIAKPPESIKELAIREKGDLIITITNPSDKLLMIAASAFVQPRWQFLASFPHVKYTKVVTGKVFPTLEFSDEDELHYQFWNSR